MSHAHAHDQTVPKPALIAAGALVTLSLLLTMLVRVGVLEREAVPAAVRAADRASVVETRNLTFSDRADGAVVIADASTAATVAVIESETKSGGFIRGVLRGLARERRSRGIGAAPPFKLTLFSDGSLNFVDTATGRSIELGAFGPDNRAVFAALLPKATA
jgi:putative photosynthetic complex assembly protein